MIVSEQYSKDLDRRPYKRLCNTALVELLGEALNGSQEAWQSLWEHGLRMVIKMVGVMAEKGLLRTLSPEEAVAVGNEAVGQALLSWIPKKGTYSTWVWVTVRQAILNADREVLPEELQGDDEAGVSEDAVDSVTYARLHESVRQLPEPNRGFLSLHFLNGWTQQEIAESHGVTRQRVNQVISQGIDLLREEFMVT